MTAAADRQAPEACMLTVARGLQVLRAFRGERTPLSNAELVRRTGLPKASVSRFTSTLLQLGALRRVAGGRAFELGPAPAGIGVACLAERPLLEGARPLLQALADRLDLSVALGLRNQFDALYLDYRTGPTVRTLRMGVGSLLPMGSTAIGHALLWDRPPAERAALRDALCAQAGERGAAMARSIDASFAELEATGCCLVHGGFQHGAYAVARPLRLGARGSRVALSGGKVDLHVDLAAERRRIAPALLAAGEALERALAAVDEEP